MKIRPANATDAAAIAAFWNPLIRDTVVTFNRVEKSETDIQDMIKKRLSTGCAFHVADDRGQVLGFATYSQFRGGIGYVRSMEHTIILSPAAQGLGAGRALMLAIEDHAQNAGVHSMIAGVSGENTAGIAFHAALGYREVAVVPEVGRKFDRWMDLHLMQKLL